jgi:branched-chain amino acid transport system permease protein
MSLSLFLVQSLNGLQLGVLLFLITAGLTLVFGVLDVVNLAHGAQYMIGSYACVLFSGWTGSFWLGLALACLTSLAAGMVVERLVLRFLLGRGHLEQVLATYGLILLFEEGARAEFGAAPLSLPVPDLLAGTVELTEGLRYPVYRLFLLGVGLLTALLLWLIIARSRAGMLVRAGASDAAMLAALGINTRKLFAVVLAMGAMLAGFAGALAAPLVSVEPSMGGSVLILAFVVIVLGGTGSVAGAFVGAILVGLVDALGRELLSDGLHVVLSASAARQAGPALASMLIYVLMAGVLVARPKGLLGAG